MCAWICKDLVTHIFFLGVQLFYLLFLRVPRYPAYNIIWKQTQLAEKKKKKKKEIQYL